MRIVLSIVLSAFLFLAQAMAAEQQGATSEKMGATEKLGYSLGYDAGTRMKKSGLDIDPAAFSKAFNDAFAGNQAALTQAEMRAAIQSAQKEMNANTPGEKKDTARKRLRELAAKNKQEGDSFLAENALKEGIVVLPSGLQYNVIKEGTGRQPATGDKVEVHYRGMIAGGGEFYSTYKGGKPMVNEVGKFIKGMNEGLQLMKEGAKWMLFVPSDLAYGSRGLGRKKPVIGPNQTLIFEVELVSVRAQEPKKQN